jgi:AcrR family transcriptional regulator
MTQFAHNLRVLRTRKLLRTALLDLVEERGFETLTVGEIAERAMVSRAGFYRYYQDKYDLVEQLFAEAVQAMMNELSEEAHTIRSPEETPTVPEPWIKFFEHLAVYQRLYRVLLGRASGSWFVAKMRIALTEVLSRRVQQLSSCIQHGQQVAVAYNRLAPSLTASLLIEIITRWLEQSQPEAPQEIAQRSSLLASSLLKEVSTWT